MGPMDTDRESRSPRDDDGHDTHTSSTTRAAHPARITSRSCAAPNSDQPFMSASTAGLPRGHGDQSVPPTSSTEHQNVLLTPKFGKESDQWVQLGQESVS
jgi:hypothetical protein